MSKPNILWTTGIIIILLLILFAIYNFLHLPPTNNSAANHLDQSEVASPNTASPTPPLSYQSDLEDFRRSLKRESQNIDRLADDLSL